MPGKHRYKNESSTSFAKRVKKGKSRKKANKAARKKYGKKY